MHMYIVDKTLSDETKMYISIPYIFRLMLN